MLGNAKDSRAYATALHVSANFDLARGDVAGAEHKYEALTVDPGNSDLQEMVRNARLGVAQSRLAAGRPSLAIGPAETALKSTATAGDHALQVEILRVLAKAAMQLRAGSVTDVPGREPLDYLRKASSLMPDGTSPFGLAGEQADAHEQTGDLRAALVAMRQSADALREQAACADTTRADNMKFKVRTEQSLAEAAHQIKLAHLKRQRSVELEQLNAQRRTERLGSNTGVLRRRVAFFARHATLAKPKDLIGELRV